MQPPQIILASASPRRQALLDQIGVSYQVLPVDIDETVKPGESAEDCVIRLALEKAVTGLNKSETKLPVLGSDTIILLNKQILGKPENRMHAIQMLSSLSGQSHQVLTAVAMVTNQKREYLVSKSNVYFRELTGNEIQAYWESGEPVDKAGAYAIQGLAAQFIERLDGSYSGVMGLPLFETAQLLKTFGVAIGQFQSK
ncbi:MAG: Maf-like protein [Gammaproteobacteria bacterium]|nr:Maf-like protein [Gammaproteobacteria bacterium]